MSPTRITVPAIFITQLLISIVSRPFPCWIYLINLIRRKQLVVRGGFLLARFGFWWCDHWFAFGAGFDPLAVGRYTRVHTGKPWICAIVSERYDPYENTAAPGACSDNRAS